MNSYRPKLHITPQKGWINDPNGFSYFQGKYHIYCQYNPKDVKWGPMHWLHFASADLIHWEEAGVSLMPDQPYDHEFGCFSGSAIEKDGKLHVLYTGACFGRQVQCLAISEDGHHFIKLENNPVIDEDKLPRGYSIADWRDPKVFQKDGRYYVLTAARHERGYSSILLFASDDLLTYQFVGALKHFRNCQEGGMVECPDILFDGDKVALLYSLQKPKKDGLKFQSHFTVAYTIGRLDLRRGRFIPLGEERELDQGFECYASQSLHKDGKNYIVTWESSWGINYPTASEGFAGQLSLAKEARIVGDRIELDFLPRAEKRCLDVEVEEDEALLQIGNISLCIDKNTNIITLLRDGMDEPIVDEYSVTSLKREFRLEDVSHLHIECSFDVSCVEIRFQNGEAFASFLNYKKAVDYENVSTKGCVIRQ